ncbi:MAG: LamG-like jellyroll fold domain-containing protein [Pirellulales bacterium]
MSRSLWSDWIVSRTRRMLALPHRRPLRFEPLEDRRLLAAIVGIDFDEVGGGASPGNWTRIPNVDNFFTINLRDETGANTPYTVLATTNVGAGDRGVLESDPVAAATLPTHTQSLAGLDGFAFAETVTNATITVTFGNLNENRLYEVYVFGFDGDGFSDTQEVSIGGAGAATVFTQSPSNNQLWVNGELGTSARSLESYAVLVQPNFLQNIIISTRRISGAAVLGGVAIRDVGILVNSTGDTDDMNAGNGVTTLREAIRLTNANPGAEKIAFDTTVFATPQTIHLGSQLPTITDDLTIIGPGQHQLTLDAGNGADNVFATGDGYRISNIDDGTAAKINVELSGLTLTGGDTVNGSTGSNGEHGGAIRSVENLTLINSTVSGNATGDGGSTLVFDSQGGFGGHGGAIYSNSGGLTIIGSVIKGNATGDGGEGIAPVTVGGSGGSGGGIFSRNGDLTVIDSTISNNVLGNGNAGMAAPGQPGGGGGIASINGNTTITGSEISHNRIPMVDAFGIGGGGILVASSFVDDVSEIRNSTISGNSAPGNIGGGLMRIGEAPLSLLNSTVTGNNASRGGGVASTGAPFQPTVIGGSIVSGNTGDDIGLDTRLPQFNSFRSAGYNVIGTGNTVNGVTAIDAFNQPGDQTGVTNALLGPLADHGGPTKTHALLPGSASLDAGAAPPLAIYHFNESTSANGQPAQSATDVLNGTYQGNVSLVTPTAPVLSGTAADFNNNAANFVRVLGAGTLQNSGLPTTGLTLEAWVNLDAFVNYGGIIAAAVDNGTTESGWFLASRSDNRFTLYLRTSGGGAANAAHFELATTATYSTNQWYHVAATYDGAMTKLYVNGVLQGSIAQTGTITYPASGDGGLVIGKYLDSDENIPFDGRIDELSIYDLALSEAVLIQRAAQGPFDLIGLVDQRGFARVVNGDAVSGARADIGAYESQGVPSFPNGDYNHNGIADAADYVVWRTTLGQMGPNLPADGDKSGASANKIDQADYNFWRANFGNTVVPVTPVSGGGSTVDALGADAIRANVAFTASKPTTQVDVAPNAPERRQNPAVTPARFSAHGSDATLIYAVARTLETLDHAWMASRRSVLSALTPMASGYSDPLLLAHDQVLAEFDNNPEKADWFLDLEGQFDEQQAPSQFDDSLTVSLIDWL